MSITLPPLPVPAITMKHGPWKPSQFDDYETYCAHCLTRSIFAHSRRCDPNRPRVTPRPRPRSRLVVLEAAAQAAGPEDSYQDRWFAAKADAVNASAHWRYATMSNREVGPWSVSMLERPQPRPYFVARQVAMLHWEQLHFGVRRNGSL